MFARIEDGICCELIDFDPIGRFHPSLVWVACAATVAEGDVYNTVTGEFSRPVPPAPSAAEIIASLEAALDQHINSVAAARQYDSRITCAMRAGYANPWRAECTAFAQWMDACYALSIAIQAAVIAGTRPVPTAAELIAEMPVMVWP